MGYNTDFIMKPKVDFCFKELMADAKVRQGFISAVLRVDPEEIRETRLMPTLLRKSSKEEKQGILGFTMFENYEGYYSRFHIREDSRREKYTDKLEVHVLELPKLNKYPHPETELLKWVRFFHAEKREEFEMMAKDNEYLERAYERLVNISADEQKRREYQAREDAIRDYNWQLKTYRRRGLREGMEKGMEKAQVYMDKFWDHN